MWTYQQSPPQEEAEVDYNQLQAGNEILYSVLRHISNGKYVN